MISRHLDMNSFIYQAITLLFVFIVFNKIKHRKSLPDQYIYLVKDIISILFLASVLYNIFLTPLIIYKFFKINYISQLLGNFVYALFLENAYSLALLIIVFIYKLPKVLAELEKMFSTTPIVRIYVSRSFLLSCLIILVNISICIFFKEKIYHSIHGAWWIKEVVSYPSYIFAWIISLCLISPLAEEIFFRWISFKTLEKYYSTRIAFFVSVILWVAIHPLQFFLHYLIAGVLLQYFCKRSNSIIPSLIMHSAMNFAWILTNISIIF